MQSTAFIHMLCERVSNNTQTTASLTPEEAQLVHDWRLAIAEKRWEKAPESSLLIFRAFAKMVLYIEMKGKAEEHAKELNWLFSHNLAAAARRLKEYTENASGKTHPLYDLCRLIRDINIPFPPLHQFGDGNITYFFKNPDAFKTLIHNFHLLEKVIPKNAWKSTAPIVMVNKLKEYELSLYGIDVSALNDIDKLRLKKIFRINKRFNRYYRSDAKEILHVLRYAKSSNEHLPPITFMTEKIGLPAGYYVAKIPDDDVRNAMAGVLTGNCQHIGGQAHKLVSYSITSAHSCTYALYKGSVSEGKTVANVEKDEFIAISCAWVARNGGICFDSIECTLPNYRKIGKDLANNPTQGEEIVNVIFTEFASRLLAMMPQSFKKISVGTNTKTPRIIGRPHCRASHGVDLRMLESVRCTDSHHQRILAYREDSDYYGLHLLNRNTALPKLFKKNDRSILFNLYLYLPQVYKEHLESQARQSMGTYEKWFRFDLLGQQVPIVPTWWELMRKNPWDNNIVSAMEADPSLDYTIYMSNIQNNVLMYLLKRDESLSPIFYARILSQMTHESINGGSPYQSYLQFAAETKPNDRQFIEMLLDKGGDPNQQDYSGTTFTHTLRKLPFLDFNLFVRWNRKYKFNCMIEDNLGRLSIIANLTHFQSKTIEDREQYNRDVFDLLSYYPMIDESVYMKYLNVDLRFLKTRVMLFGDSPQKMLYFYDMRYSDDEKISFLKESAAKSLLVFRSNRIVDEGSRTAANRAHKI